MKKKNIESVKKIWKKHFSEDFFRSLNMFYETLSTAGDNLTDFQKLHIVTLMNICRFRCVDAVMESLSEDVRVGIMKLDWNNEPKFPISEYFDDYYNQDGNKHPLGLSKNTLVVSKVNSK